jgi:hypothetical protein
VPSNSNAFAIGRRRGKAALEFDGNHHHAAFQARRKSAAKNKLPLQSGRQAISFGEARREMSIVIGVPAPKFVAIMLREPVPSTIVIVVVVFVSIPVPPMSVVVVPAAILVALVLICKNRASRKHEESENDGRKPFSIFQESPPR